MKFKNLNIAMLAALIAVLPACSLYKKENIANKETVSTSLPVKSIVVRADSAHSSRNSLDWANTYVGIVPCASCPGIKMRLTLESDGHYKLATQYIDRQTKPDVVDGRFEWSATENSITLDEKGFRQQYAVQEGQLIMLYQDGSMPQGPLAPHHVLKVQSGS